MNPTAPMTNVAYVVGMPTPVADMSALQASGVTASYTMIGGTAPRDASGSIGVLNSATLTANFGTGTVSGNLSVSIATSTYSAGWSGSITPSTPKFSGSYADGFSLSVIGFFVGPNASRAGEVYSISAESVPTITGAVAFRR
jgi:hypothetical protein